MALNFPGGKFFSGSDAKSRIFLLIAGIVGLSLLIFLGVRYFSGEASKTTGPSVVAGTPRGLQSVPGGQVSPEYYRALTEANTQAAKQAQMTGGSAIPTLINVPGQQGTGDCTVLCPSDDNANVADDINALLKSGKISQADADALLALAKNGASVEEYAAALDRLVAAGKLTPEQARALLAKYQKQHQNALLKQSAAAMDALKIPVDVANQLLEFQKKKPTPEEYAAMLARLVKEGKLTPEQAAALLAQYTQQYNQEKLKGAGAAIDQMARAGLITGDVANALNDLVKKNVPLSQYKAALDKLVADGKLTPAGAQKLLDQYRALKTNPSDLLTGLLAKGGAFADEAQRLLDLQANNASASDYANELKRAVAAGLLTPEEAAALMQQYQAMLAAGGGVVPTAQGVIPTTDEFAKLASRVKTQKATPPPTAANTAQEAQFAAAQAQAQAAANQARQERLQALMGAMSSQAQSLLAAWAPPVMEHREGAGAGDKKSENLVPGGAPGASSAAGENEAGTAAADTPALIKAGTIYFAVLDTAVDSDYPDTPVLATIVQGPFKGAKLLGKLALAQGQDKVSLNFTQMDMTQWAHTKTISAYAIDPDTAHTVLASEVDHHYLLRFGAIMAFAFLSGYSSAVTNAGTSTTGIFGTSTEHEELSPGNKIAVGIGQIGTTMGQIVQPLAKTPTTVKVTSGVGIGILFTTEVTQ